MPTTQHHAGQWYDAPTSQYVPTPLPLDQMFVSGADFGENLVSAFSSFSAAVTALAPMGKQRLRVSSLQTLTAAVDVPNNIVIVVVGQGGFTSASAIDLTLRGGLVADYQQIFFGSINVKFVQSDNLPNTLLKYVCAEWWGAVGDGSADSSAAFNKALAAIKTSRGIGLRLLARPYRASVIVPAPIHMNYPVVIVGSGDGSSIRSANIGQPALSLALASGDPNTVMLLMDFSLSGRTTNHTAPVLSLVAGGGTSNRLFGVIQNIKVVADSTFADCVYIKGGLALKIDLRTESGRYALYHEDSSNSLITLHAGNATCNGLMLKGGANNSILRARIEDSATANTHGIASITGSGALVTVTTTEAHGGENMDRITISGTGSYNFTAPRRITVVNATTFTYAGTETGATSGGTARFSSSTIRIKDSSQNTFYAVANEGKIGIDYSLWLQSTGTQSTGEPSCSFNKFYGGFYGEPNATARDQLATLLIEGPCQLNAGIGITIGKASGVKAGFFDVLLLQNDSGVKPIGNKFTGEIHRGTGNTGTMVYSAPSANPGHHFEFTEKVAQKTYIFGDKREVTADGGISELDEMLTTRGAVALFTLTAFASYSGQKPITVVNNNDAFAVRVKPATGEKWATRAVNKYVEIPAGGSLTFSSSTVGVLDIVSAQGALTFEP